MVFDSKAGTEYLVIGFKLLVIKEFGFEDLIIHQVKSDTRRDYQLLVHQQQIALCKDPGIGLIVIGTVGDVFSSGFVVYLAVENSGLIIQAKSKAMVTTFDHIDNTQSCPCCFLD